MNKINLGQNRSGEHRFLTEVKIGVYSTEGFKKILYIRVSPTEIDNEYEFIDFDGGPFIPTGGQLPTGEIITKIKFENGIYLIYTDKYVKDDNNNEPQNRIIEGETHV